MALRLSLARNTYMRYDFLTTEVSVSPAKSRDSDGVFGGKVCAVLAIVRQLVRALTVMPFSLAIYSNQLV